MNGKQFIKRAREWARANNLEFRFRSDLGKGGHQIVYVGDRLTTVKSGEIGPGLLRAMLRQLDIPTKEF
jgi:hypothetical protein